MTSIMGKSLFYSSILVVSGILLGGGYFYGGGSYLYKRTFSSHKSDNETQVDENDFEPSAPSLEQSSSLEESSLEQSSLEQSSPSDDDANQTSDYVKINQ